MIFSSSFSWIFQSSPWISKSTRTFLADWGSTFCKITRNSHTASFSLCSFFQTFTDDFPSVFTLVNDLVAKIRTRLMEGIWFGSPKSNDPSEIRKMKSSSCSQSLFFWLKSMDSCRCLASGFLRSKWFCQLFFF